MSGLRGRVSLGLASLVSLVTGAILLAIASITRQQRTVAAGKRRFHGQAFERRWIPDDADRQRHAEVVAERLGQSPPTVRCCAWPRPPSALASASRPCAAVCSAASCRPSCRTAA